MDVVETEAPLSCIGRSAFGVDGESLAIDDCPEAVCVIMGGSSLASV